MQGSHIEWNGEQGIAVCVCGNRGVTNEDRVTDLLPMSFSLIHLEEATMLKRGKFLLLCQKCSKDVEL
ncbi:MAG: hypothetical protein ACRC1E_11990 [Craterilacuibacter sp.]